MALPTLSLLPEHRSGLSGSFEDTFASLAKYFALADARDGDDIEAARSVAALLTDVVRSSDVDCDDTRAR